MRKWFHQNLTKLLITPVQYSTVESTMREDSEGEDQVLPNPAQPTSAVLLPSGHGTYVRSVPAVLHVL